MSRLQYIVFDQEQGDIRFNEEELCPNAECAIDDVEGFCPLCFTFQELFGYEYRGRV